MHFAAWLSVGDSVKDPAGYYRNNVGGALSVLDAMVADGRPAPRVLVDVRGVRHSRNDADPRGSAEAPDQRLRRNEAGRSSTRCRTTRSPTASASIALRYFNAAGADPDGELGEDHAPEIHVIPRAIDAALGRGTFQIFGDDYATPDGTCLRDYVHVTDLASAHLLALDALRAGAPSNAYNLGNGRPTSVRDVLDVGRTRDRQAPCRHDVAPRRPGRSGGALRVERAHPRASSAGRRDSRTSTSSSRPPGAGARRIRRATRR